MKGKLLSKSGKSDVDMPEFFSMRIREDVAQKFYEAQKKIQPYAPYLEAGKQHSASGNLSHSRRLWKTTYGKGISRVPRKIFWRRGDHFYWQGAEVSGTRGGRQAHPPKVAHFQNHKKMNKKEAVIALQSAMAATANMDLFKKRYASMQNTKLELPIVISSDILKMKTGDFFEFMEKMLQDAWNIAIQKKEERAGKGKSRNRRYKKNAGMLLVIGNDEKFRVSGIQVKSVENLEIEDVWPLGRLTAYTENAIKELNTVKEKK